MQGAGGRLTSSTLRNVFSAVGIGLVVLGVGLAWMGSSVSLPDKSRFGLGEPGALQTLREAAVREGPQDVRVGVVGRTEFPAWFNTAWAGFGPERRVFIGLQLRYPSRHVIIDAPFGPETHHALLGPDAPFDEVEWERLQRALASADRILITHVHRDHLGGIADAVDPRDLLSRTHVTPEQKAGFRRRDEIELEDSRTLGFPVDDFEGLTVHRFDRLTELAPGVVAIRSHGHTPGHLIYYIRTAEGRELLYVGDLVWSYRNLTFGRSRPRAVAQYFLGEDAEAVADQLRALIRFAEANPEVAILVSHDADRLDRQVADGVVASGLR
jgi:glyoxylase-like metal-dependent hydrolase (beta-lactamase superfamily II)